MRSRRQMAPSSGQRVVRYPGANVTHRASECRLSQGKNDSDGVLSLDMPYLPPSALCHQFLIGTQRGTGVQFSTRL